MIEEPTQLDALERSRRAVAFIQGRGSLNQSVRDLLTVAKHTITAQGLTKAMGRVRENVPMTKALLEAIEALAGVAPPAERVVVRDDPYASRPAAMPLIRTLVSPEVANSIELATLKADEAATYDVNAWVERALALEAQMKAWRKRQVTTDAPPEDPADDPDAPRVEPHDLEQTPKRRRTKGG